MTESRNKIAISVDVEDWYHLPAVSGAPFSPYKSATDFLDSWNERYDYLSKPTKRTLDILDEFQIQATFFVVADIVKNYPGLVEMISDRGHEIGCHGLHHECAIHPDTKEPRFTFEEYRKKLERAREILEGASDQNITGFRAPNAYVSGWMLDVIEEIGFEYDSSVAKNSLYNKTDSTLDDIGTSPYFPARGCLKPGNDRNLIEFPWPYYDLSVAKLPAAGGPIIRLLGYRMINRGIRQSLQRGHTMFYFHPIDIARERFPDVGNLKRRPAFRIGRGKTAEKRIQNVLTNRKNEQFVTFRNLYENIRRA